MVGKGAASRRVRPFVALLSVALLGALTILSYPSIAGAAPGACGRGAGEIVVRSDADFDMTWSRLMDALDANENIGVVAVIDHAAAAAGAELELSENRAVVFGNPALGTPIMQVNPEAGLDLPQKIHVWEVTPDDEAPVAVCVGYNSVDYLARRHGVESATTLDTVAGALAGFAEAAAGRAPTERTPGLHRLGLRPGIRHAVSDADFETTWGRLMDAIEGSPAAVAFTVDHSANSDGVLGPSRLVAFGNPQIGTPLMQANPTIGIDLPLKILVWEDEAGTVNVSSNEPSFLKHRHMLGGAEADFASVEDATNNFVAAATGGDPGTERRVTPER